MSSSTLSRPSALIGHEPLPAPVWWPISGPAARVVTLSHRQCLRLLGDAGTGRLSFPCAAGTTAVDTTYEVIGSTAFLGPVPPEALEAMSGQQLVWFAVEQVDLAADQGWSVVLVDRARPAPVVQVGLRTLAGRRILGPHA